MKPLMVDVRNQGVDDDQISCIATAPNGRVGGWVGGWGEGFDDLHKRSETRRAIVTIELIQSEPKEHCIN